MGKNAIAFIAGLGTGYLNQQEKEKDRARQEKLDAQNAELHGARMDEVRSRKKEQAALQEAGKDLTVNDNAAILDTSGKPVLYEDADVAGSDFRQARSMAEATGITLAGAAPKQTFSAGGKSFTERGQAQATADAGNTPTARTGRMAAALYGLGKPVEAMQLESSAKQGRMADIQLSQAEKAQAYDLAFREVAEAVSRGGWSAVPKIYENYNDGNTAKVEEDGKGGATVTRINAKGEPVGKGKFFANEMDFITNAVAGIDPAKWVTMKQAQVKEAREGRESESKINLQGAQADFYRAGTRLRDTTDPNAKGAAGGKAYKMDEDDKIRFQASITDVREAEKGVAESMKGLMPGDDPNKNPATVYAQQRLRQAKAAHFKTTVELGQFTPEHAVTAIMAAAKSNADVNKSLGELAQSVGVDFADQVAVAIQNNDQWKAMNPKVAAAPGKSAANPVHAATAGVAPKTPAVPAAPAAPAASAPQSALPPAAEAAGVALDQARAELQRISAAPRPGLAAGRAAMDAYAASLQAAKAAVAQREAEYQKLLPAQRASFAAQR